MYSLWSSGVSIRGPILPSTRKIRIPKARAKSRSFALGLSYLRRVPPPLRLPENFYRRQFLSGRVLRDCCINTGSQQPPLPLLLTHSFTVLSLGLKEPSLWICFLPRRHISVISRLLLEEHWRHVAEHFYRLNQQWKPKYQARP